ALEELEYLAQPHPSAGRIPTDRGYRAYVDQLADTDVPLSTGERLRLRRRLATAVRERERIPKEAARTLANVTKYTSLVAQLQPDRFVFHLEGAANILIQPEFRDARAARPILEALEREEVIAGLLEGAPEQQVSVTIGSEHRVEDLRGCSVVAAAYRIEARPAGALGIVGPTRMPYARVIAFVRYLAESLDDVMAGLAYASMPDYYQVLAVDLAATAYEIQRAVRRLA